MKKSTLYSIIRNIEGCGETAIITTRTNAECREYLKQIASDHRIDKGSLKFFGRGRGFHATWGTRQYTFQIVKASKTA